MKILIPTDFSANAGHALKYASLLGKPMNADLILLHVYTPPVKRGNVAYPFVTEEIARRKREQRKASIVFPPRSQKITSILYRVDQRIVAFKKAHA